MAVATRTCTLARVLLVPDEIAERSRKRAGCRGRVVAVAGVAVQCGSGSFSKSARLQKC